MGQSANYLSSQSPIDPASQFNSGSLMAQHQVHALQNAVSQPSSKDKFETKSTVWADTLSRGLVNLNISGRECCAYIPYHTVSKLGSFLDG